jgi:hypothetical protein
VGISGADHTRHPLSAKSWPTSGGALVGIVRLPRSLFEALIEGNRETGLDVNSEKTKYMLLSHHQIAGQNNDIKIGNRCFENVAQFKYLGRTETNPNLIQ